MCHTGTYSDMMYTITQTVDEDPTHEESENSDNESSVGEDTSLVHKQKGKVSTVTQIYGLVLTYTTLIYHAYRRKWSLTRR